MVSLPQNSQTGFSLSTDGWVNSGIATKATDNYTFMTIVNKGASDVLASFDKSNIQFVPAGGSVAVPIQQGGDPAAKLWFQNAVNGSNGTGLWVCLYP